MASATAAGSNAHSGHTKIRTDAALRTRTSASFPSSPTNAALTAAGLMTSCTPGVKRRGGRRHRTWKETAEAGMGTPRTRPGDAPAGRKSHEIRNRDGCWSRLRVCHVRLRLERGDAVLDRVVGFDDVSEAEQIEDVADIGSIPAIFRPPLFSGMSLILLMNTPQPAELIN